MKQVKEIYSCDIDKCKEEVIHKSHSDQSIDIINDNNQWDAILEDHQREEFPPFGGPFTNSLSLGEWLKKNFHPPIKK